MWGDFVKQAQSIASTLESNLNESVGLSTSAKQEPDQTSLDAIVDLDNLDFNNKSQAIPPTSVNYSKVISTVVTATPGDVGAEMPYTPDSIHREKDPVDAQNDTAVDGVDGGGKGGGVNRNMMEDMKMETDGNESEVGSDNTTVQQTSSSAFPSAATSSLPSSPTTSESTEVSELVSKLKAAQSECETWKSRAMKLRDTLKNTPTKAVPDNSASAYEELSKEASSMNEKIHVLTNRLRSINKEKAALVKEKEELEGVVERVRKEKVEGVEGSRKETEVEVRREMEEKIKEERERHDKEMREVRGKLEGEGEAMRVEVEEMKGKVEMGKRGMREMEEKLDALRVEKSKIEQVWIGRVREVERKLKEREEECGKMRASSEGLKGEGEGRSEEETRKRKEAEKLLRECEERLKAEMARGEKREEDFKAKGKECEVLKGQLSVSGNLKTELGKARSKIEGLEGEMSEIREARERERRDWNTRVIETGIKGEEERCRLEGMIEGLEKEVGKLRRLNEEYEDSKKEKENSKSAAGRDTKGRSIMSSTASGQPSFAATVQMKSKIEALEEENGFVKREIELLRKQGEKDAGALRRASADMQELEKLRMETKVLRLQVEDGKIEVLEIREMYRREIKRLLGEVGGEVDGERQKPTPPTPNPELYKEKGKPETPNQKMGLKGNIKKFINTVKTPRVEGNEERWDPWEL